MLIVAGAVAKASGAVLYRSAVCERARYGLTLSLTKGEAILPRKLSVGSSEGFRSGKDRWNDIGWQQGSVAART